MRDLEITARVGLAFSIGSALCATISGNWSPVIPCVLFGSIGALSACWLRPELRPRHADDEDTKGE
jgi:hypothetical protein